MGKTNRKFKLDIEDKPPRKGHIEHRSGSGEHDSREKRVRTRQKEEEQWMDEYGNEY